MMLLLSGGVAFAPTAVGLGCIPCHSRPLPTARSRVENTQTAERVADSYLEGRGVVGCALVPLAAGTVLVKGLVAGSGEAHARKAAVAAMATLAKFSLALPAAALLACVAAVLFVGAGSRQSDNQGTMTPNNQKVTSAQDREMERRSKLGWDLLGLTNAP